MIKNYTLAELISLFSKESEETALGIAISKSGDSGPIAIFRLPGQFVTDSFVSDLENLLQEHGISFDFDPDSADIKSDGVHPVEQEVKTSRVLH